MPSRITLAAVGTDGLPQISEVLLEIERHEMPQYVRGSHQSAQGASYVATGHWEDISLGVDPGEPLVVEAW